jgi:hypothetical protein
VFPLMVHKGVLHIISWAVAKKFIGVDAYLREHLHIETADVPDYRLREAVES